MALKIVFSCCFYCSFSLAVGGLCVRWLNIIIIIIFTFLLLNFLFSIFFFVQLDLSKIPRPVAEITAGNARVEIRKCSLALSNSLVHSFVRWVFFIILNAPLLFAGLKFVDALKKLLLCISPASGSPDE